MVDYVADRIAVMCRGRLVEIAPREELFENPKHPYTQALLQAVPFADLDHKLDFTSIMAERASDPESWPEPFTIQPNQESLWLSLSEKHQVRATHGSVLSDLH